MKALLVIALIVSAAKVGGYSETKPVAGNQDLMNVIANLKTKIEERTQQGNPYTMFNPVSYQSQVVAGTNYKVKIDVGNLEYIHVKIYVPLPFMNSAPEISEVVLGMTIDSPL